MRQAGRTDPLYNQLRQEVELPLEDLFRHPELAARISLLPQRLGVDAIIYFQDILTPLAPMGVPFVFRPGPLTHTPIRAQADIEKLRDYDMAEELPFIRKTFELIHNAVNGELPVLGFAGAPFTLATFMIEGKSFGATADRTLTFLRKEPALTHKLLDKLTDLTIRFLRYQIESGAAAVQLFESAAYLLDFNHYSEFALPYQQRIFDELRGLAPTIMFAREWCDLDSLAASGADVLSLHSHVSIADARAQLGTNTIIQGNFDNRMLVTASLNEISQAAHACVDSGQRRGHIFNLSHGLLRDTPFENVQHLVDTVRAY